MQAMLAYTKMEMKLFFREVIAVFFTFLLPAVSFIIFGNMFGGETYDGYNYTDTYIPAMIAIILFTTGFFTIGLQVVIDREKGVYKRLKGTPLSPASVFSAIIVKGFLAVYVGAVEIVLLGKYMFDANMSDTLFQFFLAITLSAITFFALGFVLAAVAKRMQTALAISFIMMYPMMFLSGSTMPLDKLPKFMQVLSDFIPMTYVVDLLQAGWVGTLYTETAVMPAVILSAMLIVSVFVGVKFFKWES